MKVSLATIAVLATCAQGAFESLETPGYDIVKNADSSSACWKHIDYRGLGHLNQTCGAGEEKSMGLCYKKCEAGAEGFGPLCIDACPAGYEVSAGALCCKDKDTCKSEIVDMAVKIPWDIAKAAMDETNPFKLIKDLQNLVHDIAGAVFQTCE